MRDQIIFIKRTSDTFASFSLGLKKCINMIINMSKQNYDILSISQDNIS